MNVRSIFLYVGYLLLSVSYTIAHHTPEHKQTNELNIITSRKEFLLRPVLNEFEKRIGIKVNVDYKKKGILEKLQAEGKNTSVDLVLTVDIGNLSKFASAGILKPYKSKFIDQHIPASYRDPDHHWTGLTGRGRAIFYSSKRVQENELSTYEDLSNPKWKGRICMRKGTHPYNLALTSSIIAVKGEAYALNWAKGLHNNLARNPTGNDRAQVKAISEGVCDVALVNTYYMGAMLANKDQISWAKSAKIYFPNQNDRGAHINISGGGLAKYSKNTENALKLLEFLVSKQAQEIYAKKNHEYPLRKDVSVSDVVQTFGKEQTEVQKNGIKWDTTQITEIGGLRSKSVKIMNQAGFK